MVEKMLVRYVPWMLHVEGRELCELCFFVKNEPGGLLRALEVLAKYHVNILSTSGYSHASWKYAPIILFIDVSNLSEKEFSSLVNELERVTGSKVRYKKSTVKGFIIDELSFPMYVAPNIRALMLSEEVVENMLKGLYEKYGDVAASILYNFAFGGGKALTEKMLKRLEGIELENIVAELLKFPQATGWCKVEIEDLDLAAPKASLKLFSSFECEALKFRRKPSSHLIRGYLSGVFTAVLKKQYRFVEVKCIAVGDPYCKLVLERT